jgi:hypothetical protein
MLHEIPVPVGNVSVSVTEFAVPGPVFPAVSVYPIDDPADTVAASAVFVSVRLGHCTVVVADACTDVVLLADSVAVFAYAAQLEDEVALVTCTVAVAFGARLPKLQLNTPPSIEQPLDAGLILQLMPVPVGNVSVSVAAVAVPAPVLPTVSVYPIDAPADTVAASAAFISVNVGHCTVVLSVCCTELALPADTVPVVEYVPQLAEVVALVRCTEAGALAARLPSAQLRAGPISVQLPGPL